MKKAAKRSPQTYANTRRKPQQSRALDTIEVILQATAQILEQEGKQALNTNHVAERAGISIGTLYQYFDNKQAILVEIAKREIARDRAAVVRALLESTGQAAGDPARAVVQALIYSERKQSKVRRAALDALAAEGLGQIGSAGAAAFAEVTRLVSNSGSKLIPQRARRPTETMLFVLSRAITGVIRSAIVEDTALLGSKEFEDELVHLVRSSFLPLADRESPAGAN